eukprot:1160763-Pelagomonas_calceolata.AAC.16
MKLSELASRQAFWLRPAPSESRESPPPQGYRPEIAFGVGLQPETLADRLLVKHSHPALKIERKEKKNYVGRRISPWDLEGYWKHPAPESGCEEYFCFQTRQDKKNYVGRGNSPYIS